MIMIIQVLHLWWTIWWGRGFSTPNDVWQNHPKRKVVSLGMSNGWPFSLLFWGANEQTGWRLSTFTSIWWTALRPLRIMQGFRSKHDMSVTRPSCHSGFWGEQICGEKRGVPARRLFHPLEMVSIGAMTLTGPGAHRCKAFYWGFWLAVLPGIRIIWDLSGKLEV